MFTRGCPDDYGNFTELRRHDGQRALAGPLRRAGDGRVQEGDAWPSPEWGAWEA